MLSIATLFSLFVLLSCTFGQIHLDGDRFGREERSPSESSSFTAEDATVFALIYGLPLIAFANQTTKVIDAVGATNRIDAQTELASLSSAAVVKPNVDTLYSRIIIDLSQNDLEINVPNITDRFWIFPFYDVFGNNFADISPVNKSVPGKYLIRRADDVYQPPGLQKNDPKTSGYSDLAGFVNYPTSWGTCLIRILLKHNTTENLDIVHGYQKKISLVPRARKSSVQSAPTVSKVLSNGTAVISSPRSILDLLAKIAASNQPAVYSDRYRVASILGFAGLVNDKYVKPRGVNLERAFKAAMTKINTIDKNPKNINELGNGWQVAITPFEGFFGTNYAPRAYIAQTGYQQLLPYITLYPGWKGASFRSYTLGSKESLLFEFSGKPPIKPLGFWSLTVYGADQYLVPNKLNRFEQGDRSNLTYNNGQPVYGPKAANVTDRPFQVLMQAANVAPPANWTNNWLPTPAGGGDISFILRWYVPHLALTNGSYTYPKVHRITQIK